MSRYRQYRARLAGQPAGRTVGAAVALLARLPAVGDQAGKNSLPGDGDGGRGPGDAGKAGGRG